MSNIKEILKQYKEDYSKFGKYDMIFVSIVIDTIDDLLGALEQDEKENGWIPATERLPEVRDWYLAVFRELDTGYQLVPRVAEFMDRPEDDHTTSDGWDIIDSFGLSKEYIKQLKCVAWMSLPESYKEE